MRPLRLIFPAILFFITLFGLLRLFEEFKNRSSYTIKSHDNGKGAIKSFEVLREGPLDVFPFKHQFGALPLFEIRSRLSKDGKTIYDVTYDLDEYGFRKVPRIHAGKEQEHLIITPDSFIFGEGLNAQETLPGILEEELPLFNAYNFSYMGGGVNTLLRFMDLVSLKPLVKEPKGMMIYVVIHDHLARWAARASYMSWVNSNYPHYEIEKGMPVYKGPLQDQEFYKAYKALEQAGLKNTMLHVAGATHPDAKWSETEMEGFLLGLKQVEQKYLSQFPDGRFYFVFHPLYGGPPEVMELLESKARAMNFQVLNPHPVFFPMLAHYGNNNFAFKIPEDGHPNRRANEFFANWLMKELKLKKAH